MEDATGNEPYIFIHQDSTVYKVDPLSAGNPVSQFFYYNQAFNTLHSNGLAKLKLNY